MTDSRNKIEELLQEALLLPPLIREKAVRAIRKKNITAARAKEIISTLQSFIVWQDKTVQALMKTNTAIYRDLIREYNNSKGQMLTIQAESHKRKDAGKLNKIKSIIQQL